MAGTSPFSPLPESFAVDEGLSELSPALDRVESEDDAAAGGSNRDGDLSEAITFPQIWVVGIQLGT